jgi:hypothetical protein
MTYQEDSDLYRSAEFRARSEMCIREQGYIYTTDGRADIAALGSGVVSGNWVDIEAVMAAIATVPGVGDLTDDAIMLSATQTVWPTVAAARYPQST